MSIHVQHRDFNGQIDVAFIVFETPVPIVIVCFSSSGHFTVVNSPLFLGTMPLQLLDLSNHEIARMIQKPANTQLWRFDRSETHIAL
jgi:hypothetical protein